MIEKLILILLIIILALIISNIINMHKILKYGGVSPIKQEIFNEDKLSHIFFLDDIFDNSDDSSSLEISHNKYGGFINCSVMFSAKEILPSPEISEDVVNNILVDVLGENIPKEYSIQVITNLEFSECLIEEDSIPYKRPILTLEIDKNDIYIEYLNGGNNKKMSGTNMLKFVDKLAILLKINKITLEDASTIYIKLNSLKKTISFSLFCFYILAYGKSWYNKFGYYNEDPNKYKLEIENNDIWINKTYITFLADMCVNFNDTFLIMKKILKKYKKVEIDEDLLKLINDQMEMQITIIDRDSYKYIKNIAESIDGAINNFFENFDKIILDKIILDKIILDKIILDNLKKNYNGDKNIELIINYIFNNFLILCNKLFDESINNDIIITKLFSNLRNILKINDNNATIEYELFLIFFESVINIIQFLLLYNTHIKNNYNKLIFLYYESYKDGVLVKNVH